MKGRSEFRLNRIAQRDAARSMRHALGAFLTGLQLSEDVHDDIITAVGEALANAVEHAYDPATPGDVELYATVEGDALTVDVFDRGQFVVRGERPNRGLGLRIVRAIARSVSIDTEGGTRVRMIFDAPRTPSRAVPA